jgi:3-hydroxybutyrate dehydrogenase
VSAGGGGRVAVVTGGSSGIGRAIASRLAADGFTVAILARDLARARDVAVALGGAAVACDVTDYASVASARDALGGADVLVNNAGFDEFQPFLETDPGGRGGLRALKSL